LPSFAPQIRDALKANHDEVQSLAAAVPPQTGHRLGAVANALANAAAAAATAAAAAAAAAVVPAAAPPPPPPPPPVAAAAAAGAAAQQPVNGGQKKKRKKDERCRKCLQPCKDSFGKWLGGHKSKTCLRSQQTISERNISSAELRRIQRARQANR